MIPPSTIMIIYGIVTEANIGKLFAPKLERVLTNSDAG